MLTVTDHHSSVDGLRGEATSYWKAANGNTSKRDLEVVGDSGCWDNLHRAHRATTKKSIAYDIVVITHALEAARKRRGEQCRAAALL